MQTATLAAAQSVAAQSAVPRATAQELPRTVASPEPTPAPAPTPVLPNPHLRLDPALGLVVIEFRDLRGQSRTIPTERELDAYRSNAGPGRESPEASRLD